MIIDEPLSVLLAHDSWATDQIINSARTLSDQQLDHKFEIGHGSLRATLIHMIDVIGGWHAALLEAGSYVPIDPRASLNQIGEKHSAVVDSFATFCRSGSLEDILHATRGTRSFTAPKGAIITHILTHGTHHRAQALNMLRHLGVTPLPQSSVMQWSVATGAAQVQNSEVTKS